MEQVDEDLAEPLLVAADRRDRRRHVDHEGDALAVGEQPQPLGRFGRDLAEVEQVEDAERAAALDPRQVEQLVDHLDEVAVSTSILPIRSRIRGGTASPAASASRVSVSASRLTVVSGVRSSCDRLSMNSARICWRRRSSETSSITIHRPPLGARRARSTSFGPSAPATRDLAGRRPDLEGRVGDGLDLGVEEGLDERPAEERPGRRPSSAWAAALAPTIRDPSSTVRTPWLERIDECVAILRVAGSAGLELFGPGRAGR